MRWMSAVLCLAAKDVRHELRTREALASMVVFSLLTIVLFHFGFSDLGQEAAVFAPGALWVTFTFASMIGLARSFSVEEINGCLRGLLLCPHDRSMIFAGKMLGCIASVGAVSTVALVLFVVLFNLPILSKLWLVWIVMLLGVVGVTAVGTVFSAMTIGTRMRQTLLPVLVLPIILPLVVFGMQVTAKIINSAATGAAPVAEIAGGMAGMVLFDVILTTAGLMTFEHVVVE